MINLALIKKILDSTRLDRLEFQDVEKVNIHLSLGKVNFAEILHSEVEEYITFLYAFGKLYVIGFVGTICIIQTIDSPKVVSGDPNTCFQFCISKDKVKVLSNKEELMFLLKNNELSWIFKFGNGYLKKKMRPSKPFYDTKSYLSFLDSYYLEGSKGKVNIDDLRLYAKALNVMTKNPMERNIVLGDGYLYSILPTFVIFKPNSTSLKEHLVINNTLLLCLPRKSIDMEIYMYRNFSALINKENNIFYIFKSMSVNNLITPYTQLTINWVGDLNEDITKAIGVVSFGEQKELSMTFEKNKVIITDIDSEDSKYIGECKTYVESNYTLNINSIIKDIPKMSKIGKVTTEGKTHIIALLLEGGTLCLTR